MTDSVKIKDAFTRLAAGDGSVIVVAARTIHVCSIIAIHDTSDNSDYCIEYSDAVYDTSINQGGMVSKSTLNYTLNKSKTWSGAGDSDPEAVRHVIDYLAGIVMYDGSGRSV